MNNSQWHTRISGGRNFRRANRVDVQSQLSSRGYRRADDAFVQIVSPIDNLAAPLCMKMITGKPSSGLSLLLATGLVSLHADEKLTAFVELKTAIHQFAVDAML
jgi:hypothetical protein